MTIQVWWHDTWECPWVQTVASSIRPTERPKFCTCVDYAHKPLPGIWREFREVTE